MTGLGPQIPWVGTFLQDPSLPIQCALSSPLLNSSELQAGMLSTSWACKGMHLSLAHLSLLLVQESGVWLWGPQVLSCLYVSPIGLRMAQGS